MKPPTAIAIAGGFLLAAFGTWLLIDAPTDPGGEGGRPDSPGLTGRDRPDPRSSQRHSPLHRSRLEEEGQKQLRVDPAGFLSARSGGDGELWDLAADNLLAAWAAENPEAAMDWVNGGERSVVRAQLLGAVAAGILSRDGVLGLQRFLERHQQDSQMSPKHQGELESYAFYHFGRADTIETALKILKAPDHIDSASSLAGWMVLGVDGAQRQVAAIDYLEAKGIPVAVDYWSFQTSIAEDPQYWADWAEKRDSEMLEDIVQAWNREKPDEAHGWIEQRFNGDDPKRAELEAIK